MNLLSMVIYIIFMVIISHNIHTHKNPAIVQQAEDYY